MATIALMIGGAILNATTFVGGSYLAKYFSGDKTDEERIRHDKALEKYQKDYQKYMANKQKFEEWKEENMRKGEIAKQNLVNTDEALNLYNQTHEAIPLNRPNFSDYYKPSSDQKLGEMAYVGGGMLAIGYLASKFI